MQTPDQVGAPDPAVSLPLLEVSVAADLARAPHVAAINGLPELLGELCAAASLAGQVPEVVRLVPGRPVATDQVHDPQLAMVLVDATRCGRLIACLGYRESALGKALDVRGLGDGGHGTGWLQLDDRSHAAGVTRIRSQSPFSAPWWRQCAIECIPVALDALAEYPGNLVAGVCRYNASKAGVDAGIAAGDPNLHTTKGASGRPDYGTDVLAHVAEWWPVLG